MGIYPCGYGYVSMIINSSALSLVHEYNHVHQLNRCNELVDVNDDQGLHDSYL